MSFNLTNNLVERHDAVNLSRSLVCATYSTKFAGLSCIQGTYNPVPQIPPDGGGKPFKDIKLDSARAKYWLGVGAQPSDAARRLLSLVRGDLDLCSLPLLQVLYSDFANDVIEQIGILEPRYNVSKTNPQTIHHTSMTSPVSILKTDA